MTGERRAGLSTPIGYRLQSGLIKGALLFLAGLFAGANLLYFALSYHPADPAAPGPTSVPAAAEAPATGSPEQRVARASTPGPVTPPPTGSAGNRAATAVARIAAAVPPASPSVAPSPPLQPLLIPVQGVVASQLQDTYNDARSQGRSHEAIDIMAPAGTPVLAVADGTIEKLFTSDAGGLTVYQFEPSGRYAYYYAHLQGYAPGLAEKQALRSGDVIGYVGSTGNASPEAPHLHFAVFVLGPERRWWQGTAINPYPLLHRP